MTSELKLATLNTLEPVAPVDVVRLVPVLYPLNWVWLNALNASRRSCRYFLPSPEILKFLKN